MGGESNFVGGFFDLLLFLYHKHTLNICFTQKQQFIPNWTSRTTAMTTRRTTSKPSTTTWTSSTAIKTTTTRTIALMSQTTTLTTPTTAWTTNPSITTRTTWTPKTTHKRTQKPNLQSVKNMVKGDTKLRDMIDRLYDQ